MEAAGATSQLDALRYSCNEGVACYASTILSWITEKKTQEYRKCRPVELSPNENNWSNDIGIAGIGLDLQV